MSLCHPLSEADIKRTQSPMANTKRHPNLQNPLTAKYHKGPKAESTNPQCPSWELPLEIPHREMATHNNPADRSQGALPTPKERMLFYTWEPDYKIQPQKQEK